VSRLVRGRACLAAALAGVLALGAGGCASIPDSGAVKTLSAEAASTGSTVRYNPPGPVDGASPSDVVNGFLEAMIGFPVSTRTAEKFLTPEAASMWRTDDRTIIYNAPQVSTVATDGAVQDGDRMQASLRFTEDAVLDAQGQYAASTRRSTRQLTLERVAGQWRIDDPPPALMVSQQFFDNYFQPLSLYYFDHATEHLVAVPVYAPTGDQLATSLASALLLRPRDAEGAQLTTVVPEGTALATSVPVRTDGTVEVNLNGDFDAMSTRRRELMSAQIVSTVRQVQGVQQVRIQVNGSPLDIPGVDADQPVGLWDGYDVTEGTTSAQIFALRDRRLVVLSGPVTNLFAGPWGEVAQQVVDFRVDQEITEIAAVLPGRRQVRRASLSASDSAKDKVVYSGRDVLTPVWDATGRLWVVDRDRGGSRLTVFEESGPRAPAMGGLGRSRVLAFELSPDDARFVAVARTAAGRSRVYVGAVAYAADGSVAGLRAVTALPLTAYGLDNPVDATWRSPGNVAVLASDGGQSNQPYFARIDGSTITGGSLSGEPLLPDIDATTIAGSGTGKSPIYIGDSSARVWLQDPIGRWQQADSKGLTSARYPG